MAANCPQCGGTLKRISGDSHLICAACQKRFRTRAPSTTEQVDASTSSPSPALVASGRGRLKVIIAACCLIITLAIAIPVISIHRQRAANQAREEQVTKALMDAIDTAEEAAHQYDYDTAIETLEAVQDEVCGVGFADIEQKYWADLGGYRAAQRDHESKTAKGWRVFEGKFLSEEAISSLLAERDRLEQERLAAAKRKEEAEQRRKAEEAERRRKALAEKMIDTGTDTQHRGGDDLWYRVKVGTFFPGGGVGRDIVLFISIENGGTLPRTINPHSYSLTDGSAIYAVEKAKITRDGDESYGPCVLNPGTWCMVIAYYAVPAKNAFFLPIPGTDRFFVIDGTDRNSP